MTYGDWPPAWPYPGWHHSGCWCPACRPWGGAYQTTTTASFTFGSSKFFATWREAVDYAVSLHKGLAAQDKPGVRREDEQWVVRWIPYYIVSNYRNAAISGASW